MHYSYVPDVKGAKKVNVNQRSNQIRIHIGEQILSPMTKFVPQCYICFRAEKSALLLCSKL